MRVEEALRARLLADPDVAALVGTRVYPLILPQGVTLPAITYERITNTPLFSLDGASGLDHARIQLDAWASSYLSALELGDAIKGAINGQGWPADGLVVQGAFLLTDRDLYEEDVRIYRRTADYRVSHTTEV